MQRQYVANATVNFSDHKFFVRPGDLCVHNEITNDFVVYRSGELMATVKTSVMALKAMMTPETKYFTLVETAAPEVAPTVIVVNEPDAPITIINGEPGDSFPEGEDGGEDITLDEPSVEEEPKLGGMEFAAEKGVTMTQVDLNEELPAVKLVAGTPNFTGTTTETEVTTTTATETKPRLKAGRKPGVKLVRE
jgi:hypothetical protein